MPPKPTQPDVREHVGEESSRSQYWRLGNKSSPRNRIAHFTWPWFACSMSTGSIAVLLSQQPHSFTGLYTIGVIFFITTIVQVLAFLGLMAWRFSMDHSKLLSSLRHPGEALFFGTFWVSITLLITCINQYGVPKCGPWLTTVVEILFWMTGGCALCVAIFQYATLFVADRIPVSSAMPAWVFPVYPFLVIGPLASVMLQYQPERARLSIWVGAVAFQGLGWIVAMFMYTIYVIRLMSNHLPDPSTRPGMYVSVGPAGYTTTALVGLGQAAKYAIPSTFLGLPGEQVAAILSVMGLIGGIFLWLVAFWFFALTTIAVVAGLKDMKFTLNWWAFIFPNAGLCLGLIKIGQALESPGITWVCSVFTILLVIVWIVVAVNNVIAVFHKRILWEGMDEDKDQKKKDDDGDSEASSHQD